MQVMPRRCVLCSSPATHRVREQVLCEPCADRCIECHGEGHGHDLIASREFDADGCGYMVQHCSRCGFETIDTGP